MNTNRATWITSLTLVGVSLAACGKKEAPKETPKRVVKAFESQNRDQLIRDLGLDLKIPVTVDPSLGVESEFYVNHALRVLNDHRDRLRARSGSVHGIFITSNFGSTQTDKFLTVNISVNAPAPEIVQYIETLSRDFALVQALAEYPVKLSLDRVPVDLIGLDAARAKALLPKLEKSLKGISLKLERMALILSDRSAVMLDPAGMGSGAIVVNIDATQEELDQLMVKSLLAKRKAVDVIGRARKLVNYDLAIQPGELSPDEAIMALDLIDAWSMLPGAQLSERRVKKVYVGRRYEASSAKTPAADLIAIIDFRAQPQVALDFLQRMPFSYAERMAVVISELKAELDRRFPDSQIVVEGRVVPTEDAVIDAAQRLNDEILMAITAERLALGISRIILGGGASIDLSANTLTVPVTALAGQIGSYLDNVIRQRLDRDAQTRCQSLVNDLARDYSSLTVSANSSLCTVNPQGAVPAMESTVRALRDGLDRELLTKFATRRIEIVNGAEVAAAYDVSYNSLRVSFGRVSAEQVRSTMDAERARREKVVSDEIKSLLTSIPSSLSSQGLTVELLDRSSVSWNESTLPQLRKLAQTISYGISAEQAKKLGLKKLEIAGAGIKAVWVQAEKKLVVAVDLTDSSVIEEVVKKELARRDAASVARVSN